VHQTLDGATGDFYDCEYAQPFSKGLAYIRRSLAPSGRLVDAKGKVVARPTHLLAPFLGDLSAAEEARSGATGYVDRSGKPIVSPAR
jgi:hypothetical protein